MDFLLLLSIAACSWTGMWTSAAEGPAIGVDQLYHGVNRPILIEVAECPDGRSLQIVLIDKDGQVLAAPFAVEDGSIDLAQRIPILWQLREACYLQLLADGAPTGSALVLKPMLNRPPIWTKQALRPDGRTRYTRIIGWGNEPPSGWNREVMDETSNDDEQPADEGAGAVEPEKEIEGFTGFRIYPERDVVLDTSLGVIVIALRPDEAPNTVWNFRQLVEGGFYRDVLFHRIVPLDRSGWPFVIQAGDPGGTGNGGPGYWLPIEPSELEHDFGVISMARADDPDSAGSQFFICLSRNGTARLDGQYCAFGYAVAGAKTIRAISEVELADVSSGTPKDPPVIRAAKLVPSPPRIPGTGRPDRKVTEEDAVEIKEASTGRVGR